MRLMGVFWPSVMLKTESCLGSQPSVPLDLAHSRGAAFEKAATGCTVTQSWREAEPRAETETITW